MIILKYCDNYYSLLYGIPSSRCDLIKELASQKGLEITEFSGFKTLFHHSPEDTVSCHGYGADCIQYIESLHSQTPLSTRKRQVSISTLEDSHAELVDSFLPYGGDIRMIAYVRAAIRHLPNTSIQDEHGCPVSWQLTSELGELTSYTLPKHHRLGYTIALTRTAVLKLHSMGFPIYCNVHHKNQAAMNCLISLGFSLCPEMQTMSALLICRDRK
uniref:Glycine N-acyltransferase-like protein n=1 Tax=Neogobius melanostomus TaxID=47308 RepID=A0A8C6TRG7_9GOBI